jgi:hypothetical protein
MFLASGLLLFLAISYLFFYCLAANFSLIGVVCSFLPWLSPVIGCKNYLLEHRAIDYVLFVAC